MFVLMKDATHTITPANVEACDLVLIGDRLWQRTYRSGVRDPPVGSVGVVVPLVLVQGVQQMALVPDQCSVQQFVAAGLYPAFHDCVHAGHLDAGEHDTDAGVGEDRIEELGVLAVRVPRARRGARL